MAGPSRTWLSRGPVWGPRSEAALTATLAWDDTHSSAAVLSSRLVSAVGASMSDGPVRPASTPRDRRLEP